MVGGPTSWTWVDEANAHPMEVLIDHAHCERKAAGSAVQMMFRYLCEPGLGEVLSPLGERRAGAFRTGAGADQIQRPLSGTLALPLLMGRECRSDPQVVNPNGCWIRFWWRV